MKQILTAFLFSLLFCATALAQATVAGKVTDASGAPLPWVTVTVKGTSNGALTNSSGSYLLTNVPQGATLSFSMVGKITYETPVAGRSTIDVTLNDDALKLENVVVVGYGSMKAKDLTAPITTVDASELVKQVAANPTQALQGKVAGVQITNSGEPGGNPVVRIRGVGSYTGGGVTNEASAPLFVVDGMFYDNINFLNSNDIAELTILKDASASAIYGLKAANGVVLVTTRHGSFNKKPVVTYNGYVGVQTATNMLEMASTSEYAKMLREWDAEVPGVAGILDKSVTLWGGANGTPSTNTDWYKTILRTAPVQDHSLDISGGSETVAYTLGASYFNQEGIMKAANEYQRINTRAKLDAKPYKWLKIGANMILSQSSREASSNSAWQRAYYAPPIIPVYDNDYARTYPKKFTAFDRLDAAFDNGIYSNPAAVAYYGMNEESATQILPSFYGEIDFMDPGKLVLRSSFAQDLTFADGRSYMPKFYASDAHQNLESQISKTSQRYYNYIWDNTVTYTDTYGKHNWTLMGGASMRQENWRTLYGQALGLSSDESQYLYIKAGDPSSSMASDDGYTYNSASYFGRATYGFDGRYLLTFTMRADGTSKYQQKWGYFPSAGAAWVVSKENFMQSVKWVNFLKVRASYGELGNNNVPANAGFTDISSSFVDGGVFGGVYVPGAKISSYYSTLRWESTAETDLGLEIGLLDSRLKVDLDWFRRMSQNTVMSVPIPMTPQTLLKNAGEVLNTGIELTLNWQDRIGKDFRYDINVNMSTLRNEVKTVPGPRIISGTQWATLAQVGEPMYAYYGYKVIGVYQNADEIAANADATAKGLLPGDFIFEDYNHDDEINDKDRQVLGSPLPKFTYGTSINMAYKNWDMSLAMMGVSGNQIVNQKRGSRSTATYSNYEAKFVRERWHGEGTSNSQTSAAGLNRAWNFSVMNSSFVESGSYFRIQNIQVGYTFPRIGRNGPSMRIHVAADRPLTVFNYNGFTPEVANGFDVQTYPLAATYSFGIRITY